MNSTKGMIVQPKINITLANKANNTCTKQLQQTKSKIPPLLHLPQHDSPPREGCLLHWFPAPFSYPRPSPHSLNPSPFRHSPTPTPDFCLLSPPSATAPPLPLRSHHPLRGWAVSLQGRRLSYSHRIKVNCGAWHCFKTDPRAVGQRGVSAWSDSNGFMFLWVLNTTVALLAPSILQIDAEWNPDWELHAVAVLCENALSFN